jgi:metal-sulfur cluster biosynthetic enzyme
MTPDPVTRAQVLDALRTVIEPETGCSIVDLGLVLKADVIDDGLTVVVRVAQEPMARRLLDPIRQALESIPGLMDGRLEFSKEPAWDPGSMATDAANAALAALAAGPSEPATEAAVWDGLAQVIEPELGLPVTDLGMIYGVDVPDVPVRAATDGDGPPGRAAGPRAARRHGRAGVGPPVGSAHDGDRGRADGPGHLLTREPRGRRQFPG